MTARLGASVGGTIGRLADAGPRPTGSVALDGAMTAVAKRLEELGLNTSKHPFPCVRWGTQAPPKLSLGTLGKVRCAAMIGSCGGSFSGLLVPYGSYVIWGMYRWAAYGVMGERGRLEAHVLVRPDGPAIQQPVPEGSLPVPHLCVGSDSAGALERGAAVSGRIDGELRAISEDAEGINLRAWKGGDRLSGGGRVVLVTAHCDTVPASPGAYDNAGGVAAVLELAELLAAGELPDGVQLLFTSGEEQHLAGSRSFVGEMRDDGKLANIGFCLNLDGTGRGRMLEAWVGPGALSERVRALLRSESVRFVSPPPPSGDHYAFWEAGVPAVMLTFDDPEILHLAEDVPDRRKTRNAAKMAGLAAAVAAEMAKGGN